MTRMLLALLGVVLLAVTALGVLWVAGQVLVGVGVLVVGTAGTLLKLLWFLAAAGVLGGAVYFVANAWRPSARTAGAGTPVRLPPAPTVTVLSAVPRLEKSQSAAQETSHVQR